MAKYFIPPTAHTPTDRIREALDEAEIRVANLRGAGPQALEVLYLFDQATDALADLDASGADVRAERARFETVQRQLRRRQSRFVAEAGTALPEERGAVKPDRARWWWYLDEAVSQERKRRLRRWLLGATGGVLVLAVVWLIYDRFIAPPPEVRQAWERSASGEALTQEGDLQAALAEFEAATDLNPDDPELWIWQGVIRFELDNPDSAQTDFEKARSLYEKDLDFLLQRSMTFLRVGDLSAARADAEQAVRETPDSGYAYFVRAGVATEEGDYPAAIADLAQAAELAQAAGDTQLEATARAQRAMVIQLQLYRQNTPTP